MAADRLGAAVVGLGVGEAHARTYAGLEQCDLVALYDLDESKVSTLASQLGASAVTSYAEILDDPAVDLVSIASYDDAHYEQVVAALAAGKHVFVEKPLCRTVAEARAVADAWRGSGCSLASNLVLRAAPLYRWLRDATLDGSFGAPYAFDGDYLYGRLHKITEGWRGDVDDYSVMLGGGVHLIDLMLWTTGQRPRTVTAVGNRIATEGTRFRYNDFVAATFTFESGLVGRVTSNYGCVHRHQHVLRLFGTEASVIVDDAGPRLHRSRDPEQPVEQLDLAALPDTKGALIPDFVHAILEARDLTEATEHELAVVTVCAAADAALAQGEPVDIDYV